MNAAIFREEITTNFTCLRLRQTLSPDMAGLARAALLALPRITDVDVLGVLAYEARGQLALDDSAFNSFWFMTLCEKLLRHAKDQVSA